MPIAAALLLTATAIVLDRILLGVPFGLFRLNAESVPIVHLAANFATYGLTALFFWLSLLAPRAWRIVYWLCFTTAYVIEFEYISALGIPPGPSEIFVGLQSSSIRDSVALTAIEWSSAVMPLIFGSVLVLFPSGRRPHFVMFAVLCLLTVSFHLVCFGYRYLTSQHEFRVILAARSSIESGTSQALVRAAISYAGFRIADRLSESPHHREVAYRAPERPTSHIVLVIDETVRGDHLDMNGYRRPTAPWLASLQRSGRVTNWGLASSAAMSSYLSVSSILSGVELPDPEGRIFTQPSIFQYARAMGYETTLFDGQMASPVYAHVLEDGDGYSILTGQMRATDSYRDTKEFGESWDTDFRIARATRELLKKPNGQFIVILKRGNHIPYDRNYPPDDRKWAPAKVTGKLTRLFDPVVWSEWVDSYDDGLRYNLDGFFKNLLNQDGSLARTVVIYTGDHGVPYYQENDAQRRTAASVPLLMFGDDRPEVDSGYRASHHNLFATMLDLMKFPADRREFPYARSLLHATSADHDARTVFRGGDLDTYGVGSHAVYDFDQLSTTSIGS